MQAVSDLDTARDLENGGRKSLFELAFDGARIGMGILAADATWISANRSLCDLLGLDSAELAQRNFLECIRPADVREVARTLQQLMSAELASCQMEKSCLHKSGRELYVQISATRVQVTGQEAAIAVQMQDITARREAQVALEHSEALFRSIGDNAGDLILLVDFPSLSILYVGPIFEAVLGHSALRLTGRNSLELLAPADHDVVRAAIKRMLTDQKDSVIVVVRFGHANGGYRYVEAHWCTVRNKSGEVERCVVIGRIMDERIAAEKRLIESEQRLQLLLDSTAEGIYGLDLDGNCTFCNQACLTMLRYKTSNDLLGKNVHSLIHHSHADGSPYLQKDCRVASTLGSGKPVHVDDEIIWRADGTWFIAEFWSHPIIQDTKLIGRVVTFVDVTARKTSETALRNAHRDAEQFIDSVPSILIGLDATGHIQRWNVAAARTFGFSEQSVLGEHLSSCGIQWLQDVESRLRSLSVTLEPERWDDVPFEKNGERRLLGLTLRWVRSFEDGKLELLIVGADITERKRAAEELSWKTAFLEAQTNSTGDGILVVDGEGKKLLQNRRLLELFEVPPAIADDCDDEALLKHVVSQIRRPESFLDKVRYLYEHRNETSWDEIELVNGMMLERYTSPVLGPGNQYYGRIWTFRDITPRRQTERLLQQLSLAVEQSPVSIVITDLEGRITYVNRKFTEASGYDAEEAVGKNPRILKSGNTALANYKELWENITAGREWRGIFYNRKKTGELYSESAVIQPIQSCDGVISHFLAIKEDITEKLALESQLRQAQKLEAIGQLAAGIAHEINTPMQYIGDNIRFIETTWSSLAPILSMLAATKPESGSSPAEFVKDLQRACSMEDLEYLKREVPSAIQQSLEGVRRVTKIVQAMKEFSHPGSEKKVLTDINRCIETTVTVARNEWKYVAALETSLAEDLELIPCLIGEFNQVMLNLIINAAHAIAEVVGDGATTKGQITIRTLKKGDEIEISIQDSGAGIPEEIRTRIFEPFFTTKAPGRGTGQGLALAHNVIVEKHGGRIWFDSELGRGTTFFIRLPIHS